LFSFLRRLKTDTERLGKKQPKKKKNTRVVNLVLDARVCSATEPRRTRQKINMRDLRGRVWGGLGVGKTDAHGLMRTAGFVISCMPRLGGAVVPIGGLLAQNTNGEIRNHPCCKRGGDEDGRERVGGGDFQEGGGVGGGQAVFVRLARSEISKQKNNETSKTRLHNQHKQKKKKSTKGKKKIQIKAQHKLTGWVLADTVQKKKENRERVFLSSTP